MTAGRRIRMRLVRRVGGAALLLCLAGGQTGATPAVELRRPTSATDRAEGKAPSLRAPRTVVDLGVVPVGPEVGADFTIENRGHGTLKILGVETSCSCTVVRFDEEIEPGGSGRVRASLITSDLEGAVTKGIVVTTNDPQQPQLVLTLKAVVVGSVQVLPQPLIFLRDRADQGVVGRVLIRPEEGVRERFAVSDIVTSADWLVAGARRLEAPAPRGAGLPEGRAGDWVLEVRFRDGKVRFGKLEQTVRFRTGLESRPEMTVSVESNLAAPVTLSARRLVLGRGEGRARGTLFASVREGLDPSSLRVEADPPALDVRLEQATERMFKVDVSWTGETLDGASLRFGVGGAWVSVPVELPVR